MTDETEEECGPPLYTILVEPCVISSQERHGLGFAVTVKEFPDIAAYEFDLGDALSLIADTLDVAAEVVKKSGN